MYGPYRNMSVIKTPATAVIRASKSEPAVFYCHYICHMHEVQDINIQRPLYNFRLHVDILSPNGKRDKTDNLNMTKSFGDYNFTVTTTKFNECDLTNNMTTFEAQVFVGSDAPTIVAKCGVYYFPSDKLCLSSSTFAIVNNNTACTQPPPTTTMTEPDIVTVTGRPLISAPALGSIVGILCSIVAIETLLLIIIFFVKSKKFQGRNVIHVRTCDAETHNNVAACPTSCMRS